METSLNIVEDIRFIADAVEKDPADEDAELQVEEEEVHHEEVGSNVIYMVTVHTQYIGNTWTQTHN